MPGFDEEIKMTNVITAAHDVAPIRETSQSNQAGLISETHRDADGHQRADHLARRFRVVLLDVGLDGVVPDGWVEPTSNGLSFGTLTHRQADYLIRILEDIAADFEPEVPTPGPDQLSFFEDGQ
jgi:hypothetical protein